MLSCPSFWVNIPCHCRLQFDEFARRSQSLPITLYLSAKSSRLAQPIFSQTVQRIQHLYVPDSLPHHYGLSDFPILESLVIELPEEDVDPWAQDVVERLKGLAVRHATPRTIANSLLPSLTHLYLEFSGFTNSETSFADVVRLLSQAPCLEFLRLQRLTRYDALAPPAETNIGPASLPNLRLLVFDECDYGAISILPYLDAGSTSLIRLHRMSSRPFVSIMGHSIKGNATKIYLEMSFGAFVLCMEGPSSGFWMAGWDSEDLPIASLNGSLSSTGPFTNVTSFILECHSGIFGNPHIELLRYMPKLTYFDFRIASCTAEDAEEGGDEEVVNCVEELLRALAVITAPDLTLCPELESLTITSFIMGTGEGVNLAYAMYSKELPAMLTSRDDVTPLKRVRIYATARELMTDDRWEPPYLARDFNPPIPESMDVEVYWTTYVSPPSFEMSGIWDIDGENKYWEMDDEYEISRSSPWCPVQ